MLKPRTSMYRTPPHCPVAARRLTLWAASLMGAAWLSVAVVSAQDTAEGDGPRTIQYTIQQGDTCYGIAQRFFGNPRQCHEIIYRYNPHMGNDPHNIRPGVTITIPVRDQNAPDARVTRANRDVQARSSGSGAWRAARRGLGLFRGWHVSTEEESSAELTFRDETQVQMRENTLVIIYGGSSAQSARRQTSQATLERGTLRSRLGSQRLAVETPSGGADLNGGSSVVSVDDEGASRVSNHDGGTAAVRSADGATVRVRPGFGTAVERGQRPMRPRPLPPAPTLVDGSPTRFVGLAEVGGTIRGEWTEVENARSYRVEISTEADGSGLIAAVQAPSTTRSFEVHRLPPGTYYVAFATIDEHGLESRPSARTALDVGLVGIQRPGQELNADDVQAGDWARAADVVAVPRGTRLVSPEGFRCRLSDEPAPVGRRSGCRHRSGRDH